MAIKLILDFPQWEAKKKIDLSRPFIFLGSCFADNISQKCIELGLPVLANPLGTVFNPHSIADQVEFLTTTSKSDTILFFADQGLYHHWYLSHKRSHPSKEVLDEYIHQQSELFKEYLAQDANILISLGSAHVYRLLEQNLIVANCHKQNADKFQKELLSLEQIRESIYRTLQILKELSSKASIFFTISPVRYVRDGLVQSQNSKARLREALFEVLEVENEISYYPAYELLTDVLRDYRFYDSDLLHPSKEAINIIFEDFIQNSVKEKQLEILKKLEKIRNFNMHKPVHKTIDNQRFKDKVKHFEKEIQKQIPLWKPFETK